MQRTESLTEELKIKDPVEAEILLNNAVQSMQSLDEIEKLVARFPAGVPVTNYFTHLVYPTPNASREEIYRRIIKPYYYQYPFRKKSSSEIQKSPWQTQGFSPLHIAIYCKIPIEEIKIDYQKYKELGLSVNAQDHKGFTPLHRAIHDNSIEVIRWLLTQPDIQMDLMDDVHKETPLVAALSDLDIYNGQIVQALLMHYFIHPDDSINAICKKSGDYFISIYDKVIDTGEIGFLDFLIRFGGDKKNIRGIIKQTLYISSLDVNALIRQGKAYQKRNNVSLLDVIIERQDWEMATWLLPYLDPVYYPEILPHLQLNAYADLLPFIVCTQGKAIETRLRFLKAITSIKVVKQLSSSLSIDIDILLCMLIAKLRILSLDLATKDSIPDTPIIGLIKSYFTEKAQVPVGLPLLAILKNYLGALEEDRLNELLAFSQTCQFPFSYLSQILSKLSIVVPIESKYDIAVSTQIEDPDEAVELLNDAILEAKPLDEIAELVARFPAGVHVAHSFGQLDPLHNGFSMQKAYKCIIEPYYSKYPYVFYRNGCSPLHIAIEHKLPTEEIKKDYEKYKAQGLSINVQDIDGNTPLHIAVSKNLSVGKNHFTVIEWLLMQPDIKIGLVNQAHQTPLFYALWKGAALKNIDILLDYYLIHPDNSINVICNSKSHYDIDNISFFDLLMWDRLFGYSIADKKQLIKKTLQIGSLDINYLIEESQKNHEKSLLDIIIEKQDCEIITWLFPHLAVYYSKVLPYLQLSAYPDLLPFIVCTQAKAVEEESAFLREAERLAFLRAITSDAMMQQLSVSPSIEIWLCMLIAKLRILSLDPATKDSIPDTTITRLITQYFTDQAQVNVNLTLLAELKALKDKELKELIALYQFCGFSYKDIFTFSSLVSISFSDTASLMKDVDSEKKPLLHWYIELEQPVDQTLMCDVNAQDVNGNTALHLTLKKSQSEEWLIWLLNQENININQPNERGATPLLCALESENEIAINQLINANLQHASDPNPVLNTKKGIYLIEYVLNKHLWVQLIHLLPHMNAVQLSGCIEFLYTDPSLGIDKGNSIKAVMNMVFPHFMVKASDKTFDFQLDTFFQIILLKIQAHDFGLKEGGMILQTGNRIPHDTYKLYQHCQAGLKEKTAIAKDAKMKEIKGLLLELGKPNVMSAFFSSLIGGEKTESERAFYQEMVALINLCPLKDQVAHRVESQDRKNSTLQNLRRGDNGGL